ncbi:di-trans,poly-cis-decaprenylcistransferase [Bacteroidales bacterium OttesenSCG-928-B11]|nr:di-trans,poly-cis-decaprenylcistransferase [Bacteroidales bacterium OttesenSCG-928-E04]MDL2308807.1 di-trans,poly-cis-decaprenylcistransferase [Bacteroidales bacterium OttesenSCG-928-C03]MDL2312085.1 di-trans,poly-cis-decaprenylcistransferase [Bacteroidales bacterium OttesenSCG-928-B11]MDL2325695.1 di-trans,poly-cis-decaprenylcistransferase [Bacteroidales bacterium OttesenSCG-928-A14]
MITVTHIDKARTPIHVAIIMDGNGRWAEEKGEERTFGHLRGVNAVRSVIEGAHDIGIKYLTLFTFSTENQNRPLGEINAIFSIVVNTLHEELNNFMLNNIRLTAIGNFQNLPNHCQESLACVFEKTQNNTGLTIVLALNYSARWEIGDAIKRMLSQAPANNLSPDLIDEESIRPYLATAAIPDPDILIRTGKEFRISNFLLWQISYTELFFPPILWPDFNKHDLYEIILAFQSRERRFGRTKEGIARIKGEYAGKRKPSMV